MMRKEIARRLPPEVKALAKSVRLAAPSRVLTSPFRMLPDFIIIGAMKCGTTSLYRHLIEHPQIKPARRKEVHYFDRYYARGPAWYRGHFPLDPRFSNWSQGKNGRLSTGEASPYYMIHPYAPARMHELLPEVKLIALLRNPVDRAWSHYHHVRKRNGEDLPFEEALRAEPGRLAGELEKMLADGNYYSAEYQKHSYRTRGIYADSLSVWMKTFDPSRFLILRSEDFFEDAASIYAQTLKFLELPAYSLASYDRFLAGSYTSSMDPRTRQDLIDFFRPHNRRLYELIGRDMDWDR